MKILLVSMDDSKKIKIGGKHIHQELLEKGWKANGYYVDYAYPNMSPINDIKKRAINKLLIFTKIGGKDEVFKNHISQSIDLLVNLILAKFKKVDYDFISAQDIVAAIAAKKAIDLLSKKTPIYLTLHGYFSRESINYGYFSSQESINVLNYSMDLEKLALSFSNGIITVDSRIKNYIIDEFNYSNKYQVVFNAIDNERFTRVSEYEMKSLREELGLPKEKFLLLVGRRLVKKNGVIYAVEAMKILVEQGIDNCYLCIIGEGPEHNALTGYINENNLTDYVKVCGAIPHEKVDKYYKSADVILMPSIKSDNIEEATSLSMLEGMACGKVVIASAIGGMKEVITHLDNGILVEEKDAKQISENVIMLVNNKVLLEKISNSAFEYAHKHHSYISHAKVIADFFEK